MWNRRWLFWTEVFFWESAAPEEKYRGPKQSPTNSHNDRNKDGAKLLLSLITATLTISCVLCVFFDKTTKKTAFFYHFCTHPCKRISISPDVMIIARCDKSANTGCIACDCLCVYAYQGACGSLKSWKSAWKCLKTKFLLQGLEKCLDFVKSTWKSLKNEKCARLILYFLPVV